MRANGTGRTPTMEVAAAFMLVIVLILVAVLGGGLYVVAMWLRRRQLDPEGDKVEQPPQGANERERPDRAHPEHVAVESEQRSRFVGSR